MPHRLRRLIALPLLVLLTMLTMPLGAEEEKAEEKGPPQAVYHPLGEKFVVNIQDGAKRRFMQVKVQVMTRDEKVSQAITTNLPALSHAMIMLLTHQQADTMRTIPGREEVRGQALAELQQVLTEVSGLKEGLEAVYFTDFVIQ